MFSSLYTEIELMIIVNFRLIKRIFELNPNSLLSAYPLLYSITI